MIPAGADEIQLDARVLFRRLFWDTAGEKEWDMPDIVMEEEVLIVLVESWYEANLPLLMGSGN